VHDAVKQWSNLSTLEELVAKIKACGTNDLGNAWLLFCWIGENNRYDLNCKNNAAESVFRERVGVCRGYASLYHECCSLFSIACLEIFGYAMLNVRYSHDFCVNIFHKKIIDSKSIIH
jgi:transglutaminase-like putative cysteine protease